MKSKGTETGEWSVFNGINFTRNYNDSIIEAYESLKNKTLRVTTLLNEPYTMLKESWHELKGNDRYEGYCLDLLDEVSKKLKFKYEIHVNPDQTPGRKNEETNVWNGMIGELINGTADLAIADLTITYEREEAVDFTMPFMNLGVSILFKKPSKTVPKLFSFLSPLSWDVWIYMATAYLGVSIFLFILARFSPYEWQSPHPCVQDSDVLENNFTLMNSLWFTVGSLMQQGSDIAPSAWSTRMVAGTWWFFTLIMISSYTANLAAFLTVQRMVSPIESAEDLARQTKIKYGCYYGGSTMSFFKHSNNKNNKNNKNKTIKKKSLFEASKINTYQRMWTFMESARPSVFVKSGKEGVSRVRKGDYAYLMESTSIEYITQRECELTQIGGWLDSKGYGIATPQGSPYRTVISSAILQLQEETLLDVLKIKWWKQKRGGNNCNEDEEKGSTGTANELSLANVGGVFVVLLGGLGCSGIVAVIEFIWKSRKVSDEKRESLCVEMLKELKFAVTCESSTRVNKKNLPPPPPENGYSFMPMANYPQQATVS
ncbi:Glutamate receptor ionotropic, kainate 2 [Nymphon striatum]|nr:Glutamate receptor ionotropic, kainate 2 [Nymphon striatum]